VPKDALQSLLDTWTEMRLFCIRIADRAEARRIALNSATLPDLLQRRRVGDDA